MNEQPATIWTIGHSNHSLEKFISLLDGSQIELVADVRRFPGSRRHPHFGQESLTRSLAEHTIGYRHFPDLGGRRSKRPADSPNRAWEVDAFNAYADHMLTDEFRNSIRELMELARSQRTAIMCSEALPWRCHRRLIADYLIVRGWKVNDIMTETKVSPHALTKFAKVVDGEVIYPVETLFE